MLDDILESVYCLSAIEKQCQINNHVLLFRECIYFTSEKMNACIRFKGSKFNNIVRIPIGCSFDKSEDGDIKDMQSILGVDKEARIYTGTRFYINRDSVLQLMNQNYNSLAKLNKVLVTIHPESPTRITCKPIKKSTSVFESEIVLPEDDYLSPTFRTYTGEITVSALLFYQSLSNPLMSNRVKIEIGNRMSLLKISSCGSDASVTVAIKGELKNKKV